jgi:hypothetical protein
MNTDLNSLEQLIGPPAGSEHEVAATRAPLSPSIGKERSCRFRQTAAVCYIDGSQKTFLESSGTTDVICGQIITGDKHFSCWDGRLTVDKCSHNVIIHHNKRLMTIH